MFAICKRYHLYTHAEYSLVNKQCSLSIACVAKIESAAGLNDFIIEIVGHLRFGIAIDEPHQIDIMILGAIREVVFTPQEATQ